MTKPSSLCAPLLLFVVWRAAKLAEACSCSPVHPQQAYCNADVVFSARVVGRNEVVTGYDIYNNPIKTIRYDVKQTKMFKGPDHQIDAIYTGPSSAVCGANLNSDDKEEYLITGKLVSDGTLHVTLCDFIESLKALTPAQRKGFESRYDTGCMCKVVHCPSLPCSVNDPVECLWTDWIMDTTRQGPQARHYTCIKRNDDSCAWYRGATNPKKEFLDIEDP